MLNQMKSGPDIYHLLSPPISKGKVGTDGNPSDEALRLTLGSCKMIQTILYMERTFLQGDYLRKRLSGLDITIHVIQINSSHYSCHVTFPQLHSSGAGRTQPFVRWQNFLLPHPVRCRPSRRLEFA